MKKALSALGVVALLVILLVAGVTVFAGRQAARFETTAVPYIKATVPELSTWDPTTIRRHMDQETLDRTPEENFLQIIDYLSKMGDLRTMEEPVFDSLRSVPASGGGEKTLVAYNIDAAYQEGDAEIAISLIERGDSYKVYSFNVSSLALAE